MKTIWKFINPLFTDADGLVSIGRISYWIVFAFLSYSWLFGVVHAESLLTVFMTLLGYEVLKKGRDVVKEALAAREIKKIKEEE